MTRIGPGQEKKKKKQPNIYFTHTLYIVCTYVCVKIFKKLNTGRQSVEFVPLKHLVMIGEINRFSIAVIMNIHYLQIHVYYVYTYTT